MLSATNNFTILVQVGVDKVEEEFGGVGLGRDGIADAAKVCSRCRDGSEVASLAPGEETEFVELLEGCRRRLVDGCDDDELNEVSKMILSTPVCCQT